MFSLVTAIVPKVEFVMDRLVAFCYATIKTDENLNISVNSQLICTKFQNRAPFSEPVEMRPTSAML